MENSHTRHVKIFSLDRLVLLMLTVLKTLKIYFADFPMTCIRNMIQIPSNIIIIGCAYIQMPFTHITFNIQDKDCLVDSSS